MTGNERVKAYIKRTVFLRDYSKDMRTSNIFLVLMKRFDAAVKANIMILREYGVPLFIYSTVSSFFSEFLPTVGTYALAGSQFIYSGTMTVSAFSVVISSINSVNNAANTLVSAFTNISQLALYFSNLKEFFEYVPGINPGKEIPGEFESLEFRNVSFRYLGAEKDSLKNVSFTLKKGEKLAVVGLNGAGKTTLVKLMMRFYDPTEGEILYNGTNIKKFDLEKYRLQFGAVFQDYKNFALSINENVICRVCDEEDRKFAEEAMKNSGAWDKISSLPEKGETVLTKEFDKNGVGLSGGENQKLSTARLFAHDFEIAVLDEPSSALDPVAESKMYDNLIRATQGKSVVYISHRLSSAVLSDKIIVLDGGSIAESGNHSELLALGGIYAEMFNHQADAYGKAEVV
jgi:ATP-binding cassette subfamily B protein